MLAFGRADELQAKWTSILGRALLYIFFGFFLPHHHRQRRRPLEAPNQGATAQVGPPPRDPTSPEPCLPHSDSPTCATPLLEATSPSLLKIPCRQASKAACAAHPERFPPATSEPIGRPSLRTTVGEFGIDHNRFSFLTLAKASCSLDSFVTR
jgi:hypothetical protein